MKSRFTRTIPALLAIGLIGLLGPLSPLSPLSAGAQQVSRLADSPLKVVTVTDSWSRPNDTTAYAANDAIAVGSGGLTNLPRTLSLPATRPGQTVILRKVLYSTFQQTNVNSIRIWFYTATNAVQQDNSAFAGYTTNFPYYAGTIDITNCVTGTDCNLGSYITPMLELQLLTGETSLYYQVQALSAFTPVAYQTNSFKFQFETR